MDKTDILFDIENFNNLQNKLIDLKVTPLPKEGECTKAICEVMIPENNKKVKKGGKSKCIKKH